MRPKGGSGPAGSRSPYLRVLGLAAAVLVVLPPLAWLGVVTLRALLEHGPAVLDATALRLFRRSLYLASLATGTALLLGVPYGWLTARYALPGRALLRLAGVVPLLLPPYAASLAWSLLLTREGPLNRFLVASGWPGAPYGTFGSPWAAGLILGLCYWPVLSLATTLAAWSVPAAEEETARLQLSDGPAALWSALPALRRSLPAAALLVFLLALADFGVPNSLGVPTYPVEIVRRFQLDRDPGVVARLALPILLLVVPLVRLQSVWLSRIPVGAAGPEKPRLRSLAVQAAGTLFCLLLLGLSVLTPLGVLAAHSLPLETYGAVWAESADHLGNTLVTAGGGALLALAAALFFGWTHRGRRLPALDTLLTLPYALPGSLVGVAMIQLLNRPGPPGWLYTSLGGLVWLYAALFFPFAYKTLQPAWAQVDRELLDEGSVLGAREWVQFRTVAWPVLRPYAAAGGLLVALLSAREMDATALLRIPGGDTIAFRIHDYLHFAPGPNVAALCVLLVLLSAALVGLLALLTCRTSE